VFNEIKHFFKTGEHLPKPTLENRVEVCKTHLLKSVEWKGERLGMLEMRPHYTNYFKGIPNFKDTRTFLVTSDSLSAVLETLDAVPEKFEALV
jgi:tRNA-dihydrouridine synthase